MYSVIKNEGLADNLNESTPTFIVCNVLIKISLGGVFMKLISIKSFATALTVATLSLSTASTTFAADDATTAIAEAKKATSVAKKAGFEWRDWGKMYKKADAAIKDGKADVALKIAKKLVFQGLAAQEQAKAAKNAGPHF